MRLAFSAIDRNTIGTYVCYAVPGDSNAVGTSKLEIKIKSHDANSVIIEYVSFDTDPTSKRLYLPIYGEFDKKTTQPVYDSDTDDDNASTESEKIPRMEIIFEKPRASEIRIGDTVEVICNVNDNHMNCKNDYDLSVFYS
jgi:hypothetical protein